VKEFSVLIGSGLFGCVAETLKPVSTTGVTGSSLLQEAAANNAITRIAANFKEIVLIKLPRF